MAGKVILAVTRGQLAGKSFYFSERTTCILGRGLDCKPRLPDAASHRGISRHHCLLDINPPDIRIRDFGSLNGTYVNGKKIGQRGKGQTPEEGAQAVFPEFDLAEGDVVKLGKTVFQVHIECLAICSECGRELSREESAGDSQDGRELLCPGCQEKRQLTASHHALAKKGAWCQQCGRDVSLEIRPGRHGDFVCTACQGKPLEAAQRLLQLARAGRAELQAVQGYEILRELGAGGQGAVYLARHDKSGGEVVLKVMLPKVAVDPRAREMFLREAENTRALRHPNVVEVREVGCAQGTFFFTMQYCAGGSVEQLIRRRGGVLAVDEALDITWQVLDGLEYAHQAEVPRVKLADGSYGAGRGLVHRDLKPANIFLAQVDGQRRIKIGDFGLAKAFDLAGLSGQSRTGALAGTPVFMPRQQVINFKYAKPDVDVWAAAASLYYMLTGCYPRDFAKGKDPWHTVLQTSAIPVRQRQAAIPAKLARVIDEALIDKPAIPFQTAGDLRKALARAC